MGTTTDYLASLKTKLDADAAAKKSAYDLMLERATQATFDQNGRPTYKTNAEGQQQYGNLDISYMNQERNIGAGAESSGMMKSGQTARAYATNLAGYKADVINAQNQAATNKNAVDAANALEYAKYQAMYGTDTSGAGTGTTAAATDATTGTTTSLFTPAQIAKYNAPNPADSGLKAKTGGIGGASAAHKVTAPGVPKGANPYSYVPKTGPGSKGYVAPKPPVIRKTGPH